MPERASYAVNSNKMEDQSANLQFCARSIDEKEQLSSAILRILETLYLSLE